MSDQLEDTARVAAKLSALTDEELGRFRGRIAAAATDAARESGLEDVWDDPVCRLWTELVCMADNERIRRRIALHRMEADLQGGHLVEVREGRELNTYSAVCDPLLSDEATVSCWAGPDRATVEEAVADARGHHPGHEPRVVVDSENPW